MIDQSIKFPTITQHSYCSPIPPNLNNRTFLYENKPLSTTLFPSLFNSQFLIQQNYDSIPHLPKLFGNQVNYRNPSPFFSRLLYEYNRQELINELNTIRNKYQNNPYFNSILGLNNINNNFNFNKILNNNQWQSVLIKNSENQNSDEIDTLFNLDKNALVYFNDIDTKDKKKMIKENINKNFKDFNSLYNLNINIGYNLNSQKESLQKQINTISNLQKKEDIENKNKLIENNIPQNINKNQNQENEFIKNSDEILINEKISESKSTVSSTSSQSPLSPSDATEKSINIEIPEEINSYHCSFKNCGKIFNEEKDLKDHIRTHTGEKLFICKYPECDKSFNQKENLKKHEKLHVNNKKYICSFPCCGKKFSEKFDLKTHYHCHKGEPPYKCNFSNCGKSFYDKGNLKCHEKNVHAIEKEKQTQSSKTGIDCYTERKELSKLIQKYNKLLIEIILDKKIDNEKDEKVLMLKKKFEDFNEKLNDKDIFAHDGNSDDKSNTLNYNETVGNEE